MSGAIQFPTVNTIDGNVVNERRSLAFTFKRLSSFNTTLTSYAMLNALLRCVSEKLFYDDHSVMILYICIHVYTSKVYCCKDASRDLDSRQNYRPIANLVSYNVPIFILS